MLSKVTEGATGIARNAASTIATSLDRVRVAANQRVSEEHRGLRRVLALVLAIATLIAEGATRIARTGFDRVRAAVAERTAGEHRGRRRTATIAVAAAIFVGTSSTAAWALTTNHDVYGEPEAAAETTTEATAEATEEATAEAPAEEKAVTEAPAEEAPAEEAPAEEPAEEQKDDGPIDIDVDPINNEQEANAVAIIEAGEEMGLPKRAWAVALATAMQESKFKNYANVNVAESYEFDHQAEGSDHDSVGLFQQRPSSGWGSVEELMDPKTSATKFYESLERVDGWKDMPITAAAQTVQVSAFPDAYAQWQDLAWDIVDAYNAQK